MTKPNPGSDEAREQGCICPVLDNSRGKGIYGGVVTDAKDRPLFWINEGCPMHHVEAAATPRTHGGEA